MAKETEDSPKQEMKSDSAANKLMVGVLAAVLIAFPVGYVVGAQTAEDSSDETAMTEDSDHTHADDMSESSHSHSETYEVTEGMPVPGVELAVMMDEKSGWNVSLALENFTFTPENVNGEHVDNEGHAHLWVDGEKITRLYSTDYYLGDLSEGEHEIMVTLNTNGHADYSYNGMTIMDTVTVTDMHHADDHSSDEDDDHDHDHSDEN